MAEGSYSRVPDKALRNDLTDLKRRMNVVERYAGAGGGGGGSGGGGVDEVWVGDEPADQAIELWYDPDATAGLIGFGYVHNQAVAATTWTINHNLDFQPNVSVLDSAGDQVEGDVRYVDADTVQLTFAAAFAGKAYLS